MSAFEINVRVLLNVLVTPEICFCADSKATDGTLSKTCETDWRVALGN